MIVIIIDIADVITIIRSDGGKELYTKRKN